MRRCIRDPTAWIPTKPADRPKLRAVAIRLGAAGLRRCCAARRSNCAWIGRAFGRVSARRAGASVQGAALASRTLLGHTFVRRASSKRGGQLSAGTAMGARKD